MKQIVGKLGIHQTEGHFIDEQGRRIILRGINLAGISIPFEPNGATHLKDDWPPSDLQNVSWVGRPFPLEEATEHFRRLKAYGFNCLRTLVSWEAIEHAGPYEYDYAFLNYISDLVKMAGEFGFYIILNFHQDVWSRVTGGDGMPLWLFEKIGLDYTKFDEADAAINMQHLWSDNPQENKYPEQEWIANERLFPVRTMWTLFWAGKDFAPRLILKDEKSLEKINIQEYMLRHFLGCMEQVALAMKDMPHVIGFNPLNEPSSGYIGLSLTKRLLSLKSCDSEKMGEPGLGVAWSPFDTMQAAAGHSLAIENLGWSLLKGIKIQGKVQVNKKKLRIWKEGAEDFWQTHGVWTYENGVPTVSNDAYFKFVNGKKIDFTEDYLIPFHEKCIACVRKHNANWLCFLENTPELHGSVRTHPWPETLPEDSVDAFHWYDLTQLSLKRFLYPLNFDLLAMKPVWGLKGIQNMYKRQLGEHVKMLSLAKRKGKRCPLLVGEFGIAMDMDKKKAYKRWAKEKRSRKIPDAEKIFKKQSKILRLMYAALDEHFLSTTLWNYMPFNNNRYGDLWNLEDLSIFSRDQQIHTAEKDIYSGTRGLQGFCRPYAQKIGGTPLKMNFNKTRDFTLEYAPDPNLVFAKYDTEVFVPNIQYPHGYEIELINASATKDREEERLFLKAKGKKIVTLILKKNETF